MSSSCAKCRREGTKLIIKGERCLSPKCALVKRAYGPGDHGQSFRGKVSEYGKQLREKQKAKRLYGLREAQFSGYAQKADKITGNTSLNLIRLLELRLDNISYRLGIFSSRAHARQAVNHGGMLVNGSKVDIASYQLKVGDIVEPKHKERYQDVNTSGIPSWIDFDAKNLKATVKHLPSREEIDTPVNENLIIEFYSR